MKYSTKRHEERNWPLVFVSSVLILIGLILMTLAIVYVGTFGWWSLTVGLVGFTATGAAIMSIIKNDPSWIMLDLILP